MDDTRLLPGHDHHDKEDVRLSDSPQRSPHITHSVQSPVRSVHPEHGHEESMHHMESIDSQADFGLRTADFFDDTTSEEGEPSMGTGILPSRDQSGLGDAELLNGRRSREMAGERKRKVSRAAAIEAFEARRERGRSLQPESDGYLQLSPGKGNVVTTDMQDRRNRFSGTPSSSFAGSIAELLPGEQPAPQASSSPPPAFPRPARLANSARQRERPKSSPVEPRSEPAYRSSSVIPSNTGFGIGTGSSNKIDQLLSAHAIAHEITLQALMRDEDGLVPMQQFAPMHPSGDNIRTSLLPASLRYNDPRSPGSARKFSAPATVSAHAKKVQVLPPPIDTTAPRRSLPADMIRTPYPYSPEHERQRRKDLAKLRGSIADPDAIELGDETVLTLSLRRSNPNAKSRISSLVIPAAQTSSSFDDEAFFRCLRVAYAGLLPLSYRLFAARSLARISVTGPASRVADAGYGWLVQSPKSPRTLAQKDLSDTFGEDKILRLFLRPREGRGRYAFVYWARRLAAAEEGLRTPHLHGEDAEAMQREVEMKAALDHPPPEGLEFSLSWSVARICVVLGFILVASMVASLVWVFLGRNTVATGYGLVKPGQVPVAGGGFRDAGDRVAAGLVMGICILLVGLSGMGGWVWVSWLVV